MMYVRAEMSIGCELVYVKHQRSCWHRAQTPSDDPDPSWPQIAVAPAPDWRFAYVAEVPGERQPPCCGSCDSRRKWECLEFRGCSGGQGHRAVAARRCACTVGQALVLSHMVAYGLPCRHSSSFWYHCIQGICSRNCLFQNGRHVLVHAIHGWQQYQPLFVCHERSSLPDHAEHMKKLALHPYSIC